MPAVLALALLARPFPLPAPADAATAADFYSFVRERGRPLLAIRPDYAYYILGQPVEAEGSSLHNLVAAGVPGTEKLLERVQRRHYRLIVAVPYFWPKEQAFETALGGGYDMVGACPLAYFYGRSEFVLLLPRGDVAPPRFRPGSRCRWFATPPAGPAPTGSPVGDAP